MKRMKESRHVLSVRWKGGKGKRQASKTKGDGVW
jgi:hypothetical protein